MNLKGIFKGTTLFLSLLTASGFGSYYICMGIGGLSIQPGPGPIEPDPDVPLKPSEILMSSLTSLKTFDIDAELSFTYEPSLSQGFIDISGRADASDLNNLKVEGDLSLRFGASNVSAKVHYISETLFLDYNETHLKMTNANILDFVSMLSSLNVEVGLPNVLVDLDLAGLVSKIEDMEPMTDPDGYVFELAITDDISLFFKSDFDYNFTGMRTNKFFYEDLFCFLDCDIVRTNDNSQIINPETSGVIYQSMSPLTNLFENLYHTFNSKTNTFNIIIDLKGEDKVSLMSINGDISYDLNANKYNFDLAVLENDRNHEFSLSYEDNAVFLNQNDINFIRVESESIASLISYLLNQINDETINDFLTSVSDGLALDEVMNILDNLENLNSWIEHIEVNELGMTITLNLSVFGLEMDSFKISVTNDNELIGFSLVDVKIGQYTIDLNLLETTFDMPIIEKERYVSIDPMFNLIPTIMNLTQQEKFRIELNGSVVSNDVNVAPVTINGGFQFDVVEKFGFGEVSIVDRTNYTHRIQADYRSDNNLLMAYNTSLRAKMDGNSIEDVMNMIEEVIANKDEHFMELFGDIITMIESTPLFKALNGDIGLLFATPSFSNISVTDTLIGFDFSGALLGFDDLLMRIEIRYDETHLYGIDIKNITFGEETVNVSLNLKEYDASLEASRLKISDTYFDFNSLKLFLELGINTAIYDDYHFNGEVNLNLIGIEALTLPIDVQIKNEEGNVSLAIELEKVPVIVLVNDNTDYIQSSVFNIERSASFYYKDGLVYVSRTDYDQKKSIFGTKYDVTYSEVVEMNSFFDNILYYLLDFTLGLRDTYLDMIETSTPSTDDQVIHYENLINDLEYNESGSYFFLDLNLEELTKNKDLSNLLIKIYADSVSSTFTGFELNLNINVGIEIKVNAKLNLIDLGSPVNLEKMNTYVNAHINDELGKTYVVEVNS